MSTQLTEKQLKADDSSFGKADEKWIDDYVKNGKNDKNISDYSPEPISATIMKAVDWIKKYKLSQLSGDVIAEFIYKLSVLRVNLGQELAQAIGEADLAYLGRKVQYASEWNIIKAQTDLKLTQKDLDSATILEIKEIQEKELELKRYADGLKYLFDSSGTLIMSLQTALKQKEREKAEVNNYSKNNYAV